MSLFSALASGVSGLTSQASAMGAISDNITNVNTIGFKSTKVNFQTLVTKQTSSTLYSAGGVLSKPRQDTGVQGLLQASTSQTDISISGQGFFVVNEASRPGVDDQFLYTRSGSFFQDNEGYLRNTAGFYLQAWPTDASGEVVAANPDLTVPNQNIVSTDYLSGVNLTRVGGTATATSNISIGANLPSNADEGDTFRTDVQFFDSLGNANNMSVQYSRSNAENQWDIRIEPPQNTAVLTIEDTTTPTALTYRSVGQLEFNQRDSAGNLLRPADGATVIIEGITYEFDSDASVVETATLARVDISGNTTLADDVADLIAKVQAFDTDFSNSNSRIVQKPGVTTTVLFEDDGTGSFSVDPTGLKDSNGDPVTIQRTSFTVKKPALAYQDSIKLRFPSNLNDGDILTINGVDYEFDNNAAVGGGNTSVTIGASLALTLANLETAIEATDANFAGTDVTRRDTSGLVATASNDTIVLKSIPTVSSTGTYDVDTSGIGAARRPTEPDGTAFASTTITVGTTHAIEFNADGIPKSINIKDVEIRDFADGAFNMDDQPTGVGNNISNKIEFDFGTEFEADGMTQFGEAFTPIFISQNGSRFGTFAGVTISTNGLITALFDNGETRPIFQIPLATFVNQSGLESRTGNTWNATEASNDYTLREPDNGPAGQIIQAALEASTVDIGEEFTNMIVVQRAFSAATKIISTADEMLDELLRTKR
jgi:flagellar hook protein FlgE